jgi:DNA polymerase-3 subunit delta'
MGATEHDAEGVGPPPPRANPELIGHLTAERALVDAWNSGRLAHGWLLAGPRGIGKATLAYRFARFVLAGGGGDLLGDAATLAVDPGDPAFRRVAAGSHADLLTIERSLDDNKRLRTSIVVDDVRRIGGFARLTSAEGGWRIVIVDSADELNLNGANALLKILEEPPDKMLILLVCHAPGRLLATIRSRCRKLMMRPLDDDSVVGLLAHHRPQLGSDAAVLARLAQGSPGRALALADMGGLELYREMVALVADPSDIGALHDLAERVSRGRDGAGFRTLMELLGDWLARLVRGGAAGAATVEVVPGEDAAGRRLLARRALDQWVDVWERIRSLARDADRINLDRKQVVIAAFGALEAAPRR